MLHARNGNKRCHVIGSAVRSLLVFAVLGAFAAPDAASAAGAGSPGHAPASARGTSPARTESPARATSPAPAAIPAGEMRVFDFDVVGYPAGHTFAGSADDRQIFVNREAKRVQVRVASTTSGWSVVEGNATTGSEAALGAGQTAIYDVYMRLLGGRGATACGCTDTRLDPLSGETLCHLGSIDLTSRDGASKLELAPARLFDPKLKDLTWTANALAGSRVVQIRVYSAPLPISL